jgi:hypothetical protein
MKDFRRNVTSRAGQSRLTSTVRHQPQSNVYGNRHDQMLNPPLGQNFKGVETEKTVLSTKFVKRLH